MILKIFQGDLVNYLSLLNSFFENANFASKNTYFSKILDDQIISIYVFSIIVFFKRVIIDCIQIDAENYAQFNQTN